jgi:hypothetical protein
MRSCVAWQRILALISILATFAGTGAFAAGSSLPYADGGYLPDFVKIVREYNESGDQFRIEGVCRSACTMFLGIRNVCVERAAQLMFHAGHDIAEDRTGPDTRASRALLYRYNESLRRYLLEGHYMDTDALSHAPRQHVDRAVRLSRVPTGLVALRGMKISARRSPAVASAADTAMPRPRHYTQV